VDPHNPKGPPRYWVSKASVNLPRPTTRTRTFFTAVPVFPKGHPLYNRSRGPQGQPGQYTVSLVLGRPGVTPVFHEHVAVEALLSNGDSPCRLPDGGQTLEYTARVRNATFTARLITNAQGRISRVDVTLRAKNIAEARLLAYDAVRPLLSWWAFQHDTPVAVVMDEVKELATYTQSWWVGLEGPEATVYLPTRPEALPLTPPARALLSAYHEGIALSHPLYQIVAFFRVIEGVRADRVRQARKTRQSAMTVSGSGLPNVLPETFPTDATAVLGYDAPDMEWKQNEVLSKALGQVFEQVYQDLKGTHRNAVAHLTLDTKKPDLYSDRLEDELQAHHALPVIKYMARILLQSVVETEPKA